VRKRKEDSMHKAFFAAALALAILSGCRRADIREVTIEIPDLTAEKKDAVAAAVYRYAGVERDSLQWDFASKTLTLKYDSMQVAQTNLRMAIESKGLKVVHPENKTGRAGH
jgi:uncharacterized protein (DUF2141 family)